MKEVPKFLVATNDVARPGEIFLLHTQAPSFIARVVRFENSGLADAYFQAMRPEFSYRQHAPGIAVEVIQFFQEHPNLAKIEGLMKRAAKWYLNTHFEANSAENE